MTYDTESRITSYLSNGGLFNPELAQHGAVRDLLIDCRMDINRLKTHNAALTISLKDLCGWLDSIPLGDEPERSLAKARQLLAKAQS